MRGVGALGSLVYLAGRVIVGAVRQALLKALGMAAAACRLLPGGQGRLGGGGEGNGEGGVIAPA